MKVYLGDSVYMETFLGGGVTLTTDNGLGASNTIHMEWEVIETFNKQLPRFKEEAQAL